MNILYISTMYGQGLGGKENYLWKITQEMSKVHKVRIVARFDKRVDFWDSCKRFTSSLKERSYFNGNVEVNIIGINLFEKVWLLPIYKLHFYGVLSKVAVWMFNKVFSRKIIEFIRWSDIIHYDGTGMELIGYTSSILAKGFKKPFIVVPHCHIGYWGDAPIDIKLYNEADTIIAKTEYEKKVLASKGVVEEKIKVIGNAPILSPNYDAEWFRREYNVKRYMVLFVGRKERKKGYYVLRDAVHIVWKKIPETTFVFIGYGKSLSQEEGIIELGEMDEFAKTSAIAACDVLCVPSKAEAFGMVFVEAWSMGKSVIGGDIPAVREVISEGVDGLLTIQKPIEIADKIVYLLKNGKMRREMGESGRKKVERNYTWEIIVEKTEEVYEGAARNRVQRGA